MGGQLPTTTMMTTTAAAAIICLFLLAVSVNFAAAAVNSAVDGNECEYSTIEVCRGITQKWIYLPNSFGHRSQADIMESDQFKILQRFRRETEDWTEDGSDRRECKLQIERLACSTLAPKCKFTNQCRASQSIRVAVYVPAFEKGARFCCTRTEFTGHRSSAASRCREIDVYDARACCADFILPNQTGIEVRKK